MNGSEVVKQLRASQYLNDLKILFLTSLLKKSAKSGQESHLSVAGSEHPALSKPFDAATMGAVVSRLLDGAGRN